MSAAVDLISLEQAAAESRRLAEQFDQPWRAVSAKTILNHLGQFRHLFVATHQGPDSPLKLKGVRRRAWKNHVEGRLCLGRSIFNQDGYYD